jgi:hypothetical protein
LPLFPCERLFGLDPSKRIIRRKRGGEGEGETESTEDSTIVRKTIGDFSYLSEGIEDIFRQQLFFFINLGSQARVLMHSHSGLVVLEDGHGSLGANKSIFLSVDTLLS